MTFQLVYDKMGGSTARPTIQLGAAALPEGWWRGTARHCSTARLQNVNKNCHNPFKANIMAFVTFLVLDKTKYFLNALCYCVDGNERLGRDQSQVK